MLRFLTLAAIGWLAGLPPAHAQETPVLLAARDLQSDAAEARARRLPIVLFFRTANCPYCREVEELYLPSLLAANARHPSFILRTVEIDSGEPLTSFDGAAIDMRAFARRQRVRLVPHLRFVGPDGEALAPDLIGLGVPDFYAGYLSDAIETAGARLRAVGQTSSR
jgi:hypothetical protein